MFKRLLGDLAAKAFGAVSTSEYLKHNLQIFLDRHGISNPALVEYRLDRSPHQPHLYRVAMAGKAYKNGKLIGLILVYDESIGTILGNIVPAENTIRHSLIAKAYKSGKLQYSSLYSAFLHEMDGFDTNRMKPKYELD